MLPGKGRVVMWCSYVRALLYRDISSAELRSYQDPCYVCVYVPVCTIKPQKTDHVK